LLAAGKVLKKKRKTE